MNQDMTDNFIKKLKIVHGDTYDYSLVDYTNAHAKIKIICKVHGVFEQTANSHLSGYGCPKCKFEKLRKLYSHNRERFIENANKVHLNRYDYSLVDYINAHIKVKIICPIHGVFEQSPNNHISKKQGCPLCSYSDRRLDFSDIIEKLKGIHDNKYNYSLNDTIDSITKLRIICPIHGEFRQKLHIHIDGHGCPKCGINKLSTTPEMYLKTVNKVHNNKYDYSSTNYKNAYTKIKIICPIHGEFIQNANSHLRGSGCPICSSSKGEKIIKEFLETYNIRFVIQKKFKECKNLKSLKFDFYLPDLNTCIEFDGEQHYRPFDYFGGPKKFIIIKLRDKIKTDFCMDNNIKLIRIGYNEDIVKILSQLI